MLVPKCSSGTLDCVQAGPLSLSPTGPTLDNLSLLRLVGMMAIILIKPLHKGKKLIHEGALFKTQYQRDEIARFSLGRSLSASPCFLELSNPTDSQRPELPWRHRAYQCRVLHCSTRQSSDKRSTQPLCDQQHHWFLDVISYGQKSKWKGKVINKIHASAVASTIFSTMLSNWVQRSEREEMTGER